MRHQLNRLSNERCNKMIIVRKSASRLQKYDKHSRKTEVADAVDDESFAGIGGRFLFKPEPDQQVRASQTLPNQQTSKEIVSQHQREH